MPVMNGYEATVKIKGLNSDIPVIAVTFRLPIMKKWKAPQEQISVASLSNQSKRAIF